MKRYFLGLALALLAIPGVSRAGVVVLSRSGGTESTGDSITTSQTINFTNKSSPSNLVDGLSLRFDNGTGATSSFQLKFDFGGGFNTTIQKTFAGTAGTEEFTYSLGGIGFNAIGDASSSLTISRISGLSTISYINDDSSIVSNPWTGSTPTSSINFGLYAQVPEPTTMILTGSVLAAGFGASMLRRFRKKPEEQAAV